MCKKQGTFLSKVHVFCNCKLKAKCRLSLKSILMLPSDKSFELFNQKINAQGLEA